MMNTYFYAHTGSGNHGCEALVRSTAKLLGGTPILYSTGYEEDLRYDLGGATRVCRDSITAVPRGSAVYYVAAAWQKLTGRTTIFTRMARKTFLDQVQKGDLCLSIGGDNYCYAGTEILGDLNTLLRKKSAKTVLWGCSIDPEAMSPDVVKDLKQYDLITVRESLTQAALTRAGVTKNVLLVADPAFLLDAQETQLPEGFVPGNTIGLNLSPLILTYTDRKEEALNSFHALVQHILRVTDSTIALIPHVEKASGGDTEILKPLWEKYKDTGRVILVPDQNCMQLKYIISRCRLFIGARTHATIAAYSSCVPVLVIGYSTKSRGIAADLFGTDENYVLPIQRLREPEELTRAYDWLEDHAAQTKRELQEIMPEYQNKARLGKIYLDGLMKD